MSLSEQIAAHLPFLRRYARALAGSQKSGDAYVVAALEALVESPAEFPSDMTPRAGLYHIFQKIWGTARVGGTAALETLSDDDESVANKRLASLTPLPRQALLLTAMEGFSREEAADILSLSLEEVNNQIQTAIAEIDRQTTTDVLIIEDEPIIAMDLEGIVTSLGHRVSNVAQTRDEAVSAARSSRPGLVLADIQLADGSSGIDAVKDILSSFSVPVIFITAFPERLLTGERPEPTFLITKPFQNDSVRAAISQALFFESTGQGANA